MDILATTALAGLIGSWIFTSLRQLFPAPHDAPANRLTYLGYWLLWSPRGARLTAMTLSALASLAIAALFAARAGEPVGPALWAQFDRTVADALAAAGVGQLAHARELPAAVKTQEGPQPEAGRAPENGGR